MGKLLKASTECPVLYKLPTMCCPIRQMGKPRLPEPRAELKACTTNAGPLLSRFRLHPCQPVGDGQADIWTGEVEERMRKASWEDRCRCDQVEGRGPRWQDPLGEQRGGTAGLLERMHR